MRWLDTVGESEKNTQNRSPRFPMLHGRNRGRGNYFPSPQAEQGTRSPMDVKQKGGNGAEVTPLHRHPIPTLTLGLHS